MISMICCLGAVSLFVLTSGCINEEYEGNPAQAIDDSNITGKVKAFLAIDPETQTQRVEVETVQDLVRLSGFVDSEAQKQRAEEIARSVNGVLWVKNDLVVKPLEPAGGRRAY